MTHSTDHAALAEVARRDIIRTLRRYYDSVGDDFGRSHERAEALVTYYDEWAQRAHAHELAEQQRAWIAQDERESDAHPYNDKDERIRWDAVREAANLIDPQAQPKPLVCVCGDETGVPHPHPTWSDPAPRIVAREPITGVLRVVAYSADGTPCVVQDTGAQQ